MGKPGPSPSSIVITGASGGLGAELARAYAGPGVTLGLVGRNGERLAAVADDCRARGAEVVTELLDVAEPEPLGRWLLDHDARSPVGLVIANAGVSAGPEPDAAGEGLALATLQVRTNLIGTLNTLEPLLPALAARGRGGVVVIASIAGLRGLPDSPAYSASKAGVRAYGEALRTRLRPAGVRVTVVCPGFFESPMSDRFLGAKHLVYPLGRAAAVIKRAIDAGRPRVSFPWPLVLGLRLGDLAPPWITDPIVRGFRFRITPP